MKPTRLALNAAIAACVVLASGPVHTLGALAAAAKGRIGTVSYDRNAQALIVPVVGATPSVEVRRLAARQYLAEFTNCELMRDALQGQRLTSPALAGWSLDESPTAGNVRLRLTLNQDVKPEFQFSQSAKGVVVSFKGALAKLNTPAVAGRVPATAPVADRGVVGRVSDFFGGMWGAKRQPAAQPQAAAKPAVQPARRPVAAAKPKVAAPVAKKAPAKAVASQPAPVRVAPRAQAATAIFGAPRYDAQGRMLVIPMSGRLTAQSLKAVQLNSRWAYLDVVGARPSFGGVRFGHPAVAGFDRWVMAKRPGRDVTRVSFALSAASTIDVKATPGALLVAVRPKTMQLGAAPQSAPAAAVAKTRAPIQLAGRALVARPFFDEARYGLVVPYVGETPRFRWEKQGDREAVIAIKGNLHTVGALAQSFKQHRVMAGWRLTPTTDRGVVRLALNFNRSAELVVAADPTRKQLLLIPQPRLAGGPGPEAIAAAPKAVLADVQREGRSGHLVIPFEGETPAYTLEQVSPTFAYVNFTASRRAGQGVTFHAPDFHAGLNYWLYTGRAQEGTVRLALSLTAAAAPRVYEDRARRRLVVVLDEADALSTTIGRVGPMAPMPWEGARPAATRPQAAPTVDVSQK
jgi:hypothetical protein